MSTWFVACGVLFLLASFWCVFLAVFGPYQNLDRALSIMAVGFAIATGLCNLSAAIYRKPAP